ncbi:hypothetical protein FSP39_021593 [Pinctada imbricata]|uniref:Uncharacterized protein n=1 Tax=Pinctada imbricata TaxID=66713 RepID=A0AA88YB81_PINIB|nr:hypothetical protein FSP39_021593 [Pinctada imbricata]
MVWLALCFTKLQKINLSGCKLITEDGLGSLLKGCTELNTIDLTGTNVAILPRGLASLDVECGGCPILSPNLDEIKKSGLRMLESREHFNHRVT